MHPNKEQKEKLNQNLGSSIFVYIYYLNKKNVAYKKDGIPLSLGDLKRNSWKNSFDKNLLFPS